MRQSTPECQSTSQEIHTPIFCPGPTQLEHLAEGLFFVHHGTSPVSNFLLHSSQINGEFKQNGSTADMIFRIPRLIEHVSSIMTLEVSCNSNFKSSCNHESNARKGTCS